MLFGEIFDRFVQESPFAVMTRATLENLLPAKAIDDVFEQTADKQYSRDLLFSSCVDVLALVVSRAYKFVKTAYLKRQQQVGVTLKSLYEKLARTEPEVCAALVRLSAERAGEVLKSLDGQREPLLPGYAVRVVDGNHLGATHKRLKEQRGHSAAPLPGQTVPVFDPDRSLITDVVPCEDGHAQERSLQAQLLTKVQQGEVWVADRNFCTVDFLHGIRQRQAYFVIRWHAQMTVQEQGDYTVEEETETGWVSERAAEVQRDGQGVMTVRQIRIRLKKPTEDGAKEIYLLTNLPAKVRGVVVAHVYLKRWTIEVTFGELTVNLKCEVNTLAYPKAALLGFCVALVMYNVLSVVQAAMRAAHGAKTVDEKLSSYYVAEEVGGVYRGMMIALPATWWHELQEMTAVELAKLLTDWAAQVDLRRYAKSRRPPKKKVERIDDGTPHVSTARLLAKRQPPKG